MKRLHLHVSVRNIAESVGFYSALFAAPPSVEKPDYAKWMLDDPRVNFAISTRAARPGLDHLGIQVEMPAELAARRRRKPMPDRIYNIMFLCTGNSARSIMAEAILRLDGLGRFQTYSAGSHPAGQVNPFALKVLEGYDYPTDGLRSKSWDEFAGSDAPLMDFVFTVCDDAAGQICPVWPGHPMTAHWGIDDPALVSGSDIQKAAAFVQAFKYLRNRINLFLSLPLASVDKMALGTRLREIGRAEGASTPEAGVA